MRVSRFYVADKLTENQDMALSDKTSHYLLKVLRLKPGSKLILFNGDGYDYTAELTAAEKKTAIVSIQQRGEQQAPAKLNIHLGIGLSKGDRLEQVLQKSTELGVTEISLLNTEFTAVKRRPEQQEKKFQHWQGIIQSACEQSGRRYLPKLHQPCSLDQWLRTFRHELKLVLTPTASAAMKDHQATKDLALLIGPEGGLSENEVNLATSQGFHQVRLGSHVLRTETAPLAAIAAAQTLWGDFR